MTYTQKYYLIGIFLGFVLGVSISLLISMVFILKATYQEAPEEWLNCDKRDAGWSLVTGIHWEHSCITLHNSY